jgi:hypothetical protein
MAKITPETLISSNFRKKDWDKLRENLISTIDEPWNEEWDICLQALSDRTEARFLNPLRMIQPQDTKHGEGFTVTAIICILLEFFSALYQGKIYTTREPNEGESLRPYEYHSSSEVIREFLINQKPFCDDFDNAKASKFYSNIRCGLLHEARTKKNWIIRYQNGNQLIEKVGSDIVLYRKRFLDALIEWFEYYKTEVKTNRILRMHLITKLDDIADVAKPFVENGL